MNRVGHTANCLSHAAQPADCAPEIFMKTRPPLRANKRPAFLGAEYNVVVETVVG
ncbi:MAG: hypothetical protein ACI8QI_000029 [Limisphaerales bacterium]|jgi:hypothetical protein